MDEGASAKRAAKKNDRMSEIQAGLWFPGLDRIIDVSQAAG
jgi:hypothetical protein